MAAFQFLTLGLAAGFVAAVVRTTVKEQWLQRLPVLIAYPFGCAVCMGFWCTLGVALWFGSASVVEFFASAGIAAWLNGQLVPAPLPALDAPPFGEE